SVLRLPSPTLTGPMVLSAAVHLGALTASRPPTELIIAAQLVVGASIGCRFAGIPVRHVLRAVRYAIGSTVVMLAIGIAFSAVLATG
ncbi:MAG: AbrB family transcriptional regulator, partial [Gammaproteobacteria bacterium]|nr:AbrB family transcriptional regulator [Gammaproteobacteria bacterium]